MEEHSKSATLLLLIQLVSLSLVTADMSFYAIAVGQGDSCIIQCPNRNDILIIDMGGTQPQYIIPSYITDLLKNKFGAANSGKNIHIMVTHPHTDHYSYITRAIDSALLANVRQIILGGQYSGYGKTLRTWLESNVKNVYTINNQNMCFGNTNCTLTSSRTGELAEVWRAYEEGVSVNDPWQLCGSSSVKFTVLGANLGNQNSPNSQCIVLKIQYNSWSMFMSGDFEMVTPQQDIVNTWPASTLKSNYYKVAHHGAWTDKKPNLPALLAAIQPQKVYVSQGYPSLSKFHHPNSITIDNLKALSSIVKIDPSTNSPFVYWDSGTNSSVEMKGGMDRAIYETCRQYISSNDTQVCQDIWIRTDGTNDEMSYVDVPSKYLYKQATALNTDQENRDNNYKV